MQGIEFRFLVVHDSTSVYKNEKRRSLQYRVKQDTTFYAGSGPHPKFVAKIELSKWIDVPTVHVYE